jgi:hypothetical protein
LVAEIPKATQRFWGMTALIINLVLLRTSFNSATLLGESWQANTTQTITWSSAPNTGSYNWVVPYIESNNCLVRVSDTATSASDTGNAVFTIFLPPSR